MLDLFTANDVKLDHLLSSGVANLLTSPILDQSQPVVAITNTLSHVYSEYTDMDAKQEYLDFINLFNRAGHSELLFKEEHTDYIFHEEIFDFNVYNLQAELDCLNETNRLYGSDKLTLGHLPENLQYAVDKLLKYSKELNREDFKIRRVVQLFPHGNINSQYSIFPVVEHMGCDGTTDRWHHSRVNKILNDVGINYAEVYKRAYPDGVWFEPLPFNPDQHIFITDSQKDNVINALYDLYQLNNRSLVDELIIEVETKLNIQVPQDIF